MLEEILTNSKTSMNFNTSSTFSLNGNIVKNHKGEIIGSIREIMVNLDEGKFVYAVLSLEGLDGLSDRYLAIPWSNITIDQENKCCIVNMSREHLETSPGFDKDHWPQANNVAYLTKVFDYHKVSPFWTEV